MVSGLGLHVRAVISDMANCMPQGLISTAANVMASVTKPNLRTHGDAPISVRTNYGQDLMRGQKSQNGCAGKLFIVFAKEQARLMIGAWGI